MKKRKIFMPLLLIGISSFAFISCNDTSKPNPGDNNGGNDNLPLDTEERKNTFLKSVADSVNIQYTSFTQNPPKTDRKNVYFTDLHDFLEDVKFTISGKDSDKVSASITNFKVERDKEGLSISNRTGKGTIVFEFTLKSDPKIKYTKEVVVDGFASNPYNAGSDGSIPTNLQKTDNVTFLKKYVTSNQEERFNIDNEEYVKTLKLQLTQGAGNFDAANYRPELKITEEKKKEFDAKAKEAKIDTYDNSLMKGFTLPSYDDKGEYKGLDIYDKPEVTKGPSWLDAAKRDPYQIVGIPRYLPNEMYKKIALQTFHVTFNNQDEKDAKVFHPTSGTMWIMDFQKKDDNKYPTKWYFGTNVHVADALTNKTASISFSRLNPDAGIQTVFKLLGFDENFTSFGFPLDLTNKNNWPIKVVFSGKDFLKKDPSDYLIDAQKNTFKDKKEFIDFAVIELDFEKLQQTVGQNGSSITYGNKSYDSAKINSLFNDKSEFAKLFTNDYADKKEDHIKFLKKSYLKDYKQIDFPLLKQDLEKYKGDSLYILGYPLALQDFYLKEYEDEDQIKSRKRDFSLWVNADSELFPKGSVTTNDSEKAKKGNYLSYSVGYRTFTDKPGVVDEFISATRLGKDLYTDSEKKQWVASGLAYSPRHYVPYGGASGSSVRNDKNELVAVFHGANSGAKTGLAAAFRSEGYDFKGAYGTGDKAYHLPQYDLIYGGGKDQQKSYREEMKKLYGSDTNFKTNLFPQGLDHVEEGFTFDNSSTATESENN
ncbi:Ig-specific serine endopeptidase MIP [Mycoplasma sp. Z386]